MFIYFVDCAQERNSKLYDLVYKNFLFSNYDKCIRVLNGTNQVGCQCKVFQLYLKLCLCYFVVSLPTDIFFIFSWKIFVISCNCLLEVFVFFSDICCHSQCLLLMYCISVHNSSHHYFLEIVSNDVKKTIYCICYQTFALLLLTQNCYHWVILPHMQIVKCIFYACLFVL